MKRKWYKKIKNFLIGFQGTAIHCPKSESMEIRAGGSFIITAF